MKKTLLSVLLFVGLWFPVVSWGQSFGEVSADRVKVYGSLTAPDITLTDDLVVGDDADVVGDFTAGTITSDAGVTATTTVTATTNVVVGNKLLLGVQTLTIADSGDGNPGADTTTAITDSLVKVTCSDSDGCDYTLAETGAVDGQFLIVTNVGTNAVTMKNSANVAEQCADTDLVLAAGEGTSYIYNTNEWIAASCSIDTTGA